MANGNELIPILQMTMRLLEKKQDEEDPAVAAKRQYDRDARVLFHGVHYLKWGPGYGPIEATPVYARGRELSEDRPVVPYHENPHAQRSNVASLYFEQLHGREPVAGDMLRQSDGEKYQFRELMNLAEFIDAWQRQIPEIFCPVRIEEGRRVYRHERVFRAALPPGHPGRQSPLPNWEEWLGDEEYTLGSWWAHLRYALDVPESEMKNIQAVTFLGVIDGKHQCRPATDEECNVGVKEPA